MNNVKFTFPGGKFKCLTMSYDDGRIYDRRLVDIFNKYGIKGTFHLNASKLDKDNFVTTAEIPELYKGHEVSCHMYTHPQAPYIPERSIMEEIRLDKDALEKACGYIVRGMSYPYGKFNERVADVLRMTGMEYSRTTRKTLSFMLPEDFLIWHPTCHHKDNISELADRFLASDGSRWKDLDVFYVWGHSYEFNDNDNWEIIEDFCEKVSNKDFVWYATNIEIVDYVNALRSVRMSQSLDMAYNPTATDVWFWVNGETVRIPAGETVRLA